MRLMKKFKYISLVTLAVVVCLLAVPPLAVNADTTLPEEFHGDLTVNGAAAAVGTVIVAKIGGAERGSFTTTEAGKYGGPETFDSRLVVSGEEAEIGETITFWINGAKAKQAAIYEPGLSRNLDLSAEVYPLDDGDVQIEQALDYLRGQQEANGRIAAYLTSAWAVMAIAAAGEDPHTWTAGDTSIVEYLQNNANHLDPYKATDWERAILAIVAAGDNPRDFGDLDYVDTLLDFYDGNQMGDDGMLNDDFWGILALAAIGESTTAIQNMAAFIMSNQNGDGGWGWTVGGNSDADNTAAAISALVAAGKSPGSPVITDALSYLKTQQQNNGGFLSEGNTNTAVNSWVINAISDVGQSPVADEWRKSGNNAVGYLLSLQDADGAFKWTATKKSYPEWMTAYAIIALLGKSWPRDTSPPIISNLAPSSGASTTSRSPVVSASYTDAVSGIDEATARIILDGTNVTADASVSDIDITYAASGLDYDTHSVKVIVSDKKGNQASKSWSFQVVDDSGGGGGNGGGSPGIISVSESVNSSGKFTEEVTGKSEDGKVKITIPKNTVGKNQNGQPLHTITIKEKKSPPDPPTDTNIIGLVYDLEPDGSTFDPPIYVTLSYKQSQIPDGVAEENMVLAIWDKTKGEWEILPCTVNPTSNTITADVAHFCEFTIIAYTRPADISVSNISLSPGQVNIGETATLTATVTNSGDLQGTYDAILKIDGVATQTRQVEIDGGDSKTISFSIRLDSAGSHTVSVGNLPVLLEVIEPDSPAEFHVGNLSISPPEVKAGENVNISVSLNNAGDLAGTYEVTLKIDNAVVEAKEANLDGGASQKVTFVVARDTAGSYTVDINGLSGTFIVTEEATSPPTIEASPEPPTDTSKLPPPPPDNAISWWIIVIIIAAVVVVGLLIFLLVRRA